MDATHVLCYGRHLNHPISPTNRKGGSHMNEKEISRAMALLEEEDQDYLKSLHIGNWVLVKEFNMEG